MIFIDDMSDVVALLNTTQEMADGKIFGPKFGDGLIKMIK